MAKERPSVVGDDILEAVRAMLATTPATDAKTTRQWSEEWGISRHNATAMIGHAIKAGLMEADSIMVPDMAGRISWRPAYRVVKPQTRRKG